MEAWKDKFYGGSAWKNCRRAYVAERISIDGGICEQCHNAPGFIVHHRIPLNRINVNNPEIALNFNNFFYVCKECHDRYEGHFYNKNASEKYKSPRKFIKKHSTAEKTAKVNSKSEEVKKITVFFNSDGEPTPPGD